MRVVENKNKSVALFRKANQKILDFICRFG